MLWYFQICSKMILLYIYAFMFLNLQYVLLAIGTFQFSSVAQSCRIHCDPMNHSTQGLLSITNSWSPPKLMSIESVMQFNHLILCQPLFLLPSIFPSIRVFSNESDPPIRWPEYWNFSFTISTSNEHPGLISFRIDWLDFLAVQGTLKCLLQHHSSKASILCLSAFFIYCIIYLPQKCC